MFNQIFQRCKLCVHFVISESSASLHFESVFVGQEVTLKCFLEGTGANVFFWYKQPLGQKPQLMSEFFNHKEIGTFADDFKNDPRFELQTNEDKNHLKISNVKISDSSTYYCISSYTYKVTFLEAYSLHVRDTSSDIQTSVHQSSSENIHAGDSVTLKTLIQDSFTLMEHIIYGGVFSLWLVGFLERIGLYPPPPPPF
uniref:Ig-like domain-containing protein n=1 Tax=Oryzias latipes TaxID=8090 RepID=A0A3B3H912_ORYLA